jgi:glycosyltransferase involved in cell wall biosynthesis
MAVPAVSVVIPVYNRAAYVVQAVRSALDQTLSPLEVLVVDDGSEDGSPELVEALGHERIKLLRLEHAGAPAARNRGIAEARGDFLLWLDSDDVLEPGTIATYAEALEEFPRAEVLYGKLAVVYPDLSPMDTLLARDYYGRNPELMRELFFANPIPNVATLVKKDCYERAGNYDESFPRAHDYEFWTRLAPKAHFKHVRRVVARYRWHTANITAGAGDKDRGPDLRVVLAHIERCGLESLFPELLQGPVERREDVLGRIEERLRSLDPDGPAGAIAVRLRQKYAS